MRMQSSTATCSYGFPGQTSGLFFDRRRSSARQDYFARARGGSGMLKRRQRDEEEPAAGTAAQLPHRAGGLAYDPQNKRFVLDRFKRMRLSSPPTSPPADEHVRQDNATMRDADAGADADDQAIIPLPQRQEQRQVTLRPIPGAWRARSDAGPYPAGYAMPPDDETCTALVLFNPYQDQSLTRTPRVELVESDDDDNDDDDSASTSHESQSPANCQAFVRFEEIPDDEDEPMEID